MPERMNGEKAHEIFRYIFDLSPDSIIVADASGTILMGNRKACDVSGYPIEELIGKNSLEYVVPEEHQRLVEELKNVLTTGERKDLVFTYLKKDGSRIPIEFTVRWFNDLPGIGPCSLTIGRDVTARIQYEIAYQTLLENILHGILVFQDAVLVYANQAALKSLGFTQEELENFSREELYRLVHPDDVPIALQQVRSSNNGEHPAREFHFRILDKNGQLHWIETSAINIIYQGKQALQISMLDTTRRKEAEEQLQKSLQRYQALAESAPDGIYIIDREERFKYVNRKGAQMMGHQVDEIIGNLRSKFFPQDIASDLYQTRQKVFETGQSLQVEDQVPTSNGMLWFSTWFVPLRNEDGLIDEVMGIARNIDAQKKAEQLLKNAKNELEQRVAERTSELVASQEYLKRLAQQIVTAQEEERHRVARELHDEAGQALITLKFDMAILQDELRSLNFGPSERVSKALTLIDETTNRIRNLSHSLRPPVLDIAGINLSLEDYCSEFASRTRIPVTYSGVDIPRLPDEIGISLYRILQEALTNTAKHAQATAVNVTLERKNKEICLTVHDNGRGFDDQVSTNGIGLLGMQERLDLLGGKLEIKTEPGQGTNLVACIDWEEEII